MTGRLPMGQSGRLTSLENGRWQTQSPRSWGCQGSGTDAPFPPSYPSVKIKNDLSVWFSYDHNKCHNPSHLPITCGRIFGGNDECNRTTTWFHHRSSPRCCGKPVTSHLGNPLNSCSTFFRLSMVTKHSTQNMIFTCTSKGNTLPNGLSSGSTSPWYFMLTGKAWMWALRSVPPYSSVPWTNPLLVPGPFVHGRESVPMGGTP